MSFRSKIIVGIALIEIFFLGILVTTTLHYSKSYSETEMLKQSHLTAKLLTESLKPAVLSFDIAATKLLINNILTQSDIVYVRVIFHDEVIAESGVKSEREKPFIEHRSFRDSQNGVFNLYENILVNGVKIGRIELGVSTQKLSSFQKQNKHNMLMICVLELFLSAIFSLVFGTYMTHRMKNIEEAAEAISEGQLDIRIDAPGNDEFSKTARAFNKMSSSLMKYRDAREEKEAELQANRRDLEKIVAQRTEKLENLNTELKDRAQKLEELSEENQRISQAKSEFLASMSHEIRTPMNGVLGMLGLLLKEDLSSSSQHKAQVAQKSAKSLLSIINDILDFSKIEAGKLNLEILDFNLRNYIDDFAEAMASQCEEKGLELILDLRGIGDSMVRGDPGRVRQIISNLVGNAIKFTHEGEIIIRAKLEENNKGSLIFRCDVSDTGVGISENKLAHIFDVFAQADASTTREYGGTGLGLAIVKELCELMGGTIEVRSKESRGSTFSFNIALERSEKSVQVLPQVKLQGVKILIIDDNNTNLEVLQGQLELWGGVVTTATSGAEALNILNTSLDEKQIFALAFLDYQMPKMDGVQLAKHIRSDKRLDFLPLVLMTSISNNTNLDTYEKIGFAGYFPKPVTTEDVFGALSIALSKELNSLSSPLITSNYIGVLEHPQALQELRILLVDDNQINQEVAIGILEDLGAYIDCAANGFEAISSLKSQAQYQPYDLVLMDCQMPEMDGYEATKKIRDGIAGNKNQLVPIIAMTANVLQGDKEKCLACGMDDYIPKPIEHETLAEKISQWTNKKQALQQERKVDMETNQVQVIELDNLAIWDEAALLKRVRGKKERVYRLLEGIHTHLSESKVNIINAIDSADYVTIISESHSIKGSMANLGGMRVSWLATQMEVAGKAQDQENLNKFLPLLITEIDNFIEIINKTLADRPIT